MKRLLPLLLLCACAGSFVDHNGVPLTPPDDGGGNPPQCTPQNCTSPQGGTAQCVQDACVIECTSPNLRVGATCAAPTAIAAGGDHTCAILVGGAVRCWGDNAELQLGVEGPSTGSPVGPTLQSPATQIAASTTQTCALLADHSVWCWGAGTAPHAIDGIAGAPAAIAAGDAHACAATAGGVFCWGDNSLGQLGSGSAHASAAAVSGVPGASNVVAGKNHTCAAAGSQLYCWGANDRGQCGNNNFSTTALPAPVVGSPGTSFSAAGEAHTCSATSSGALSCWGANFNNQIDNSGQDQKAPRGVRSNTSAVTGGAGHTCLVDTGDLFCWGLNNTGQLGTGDFAGADSPKGTEIHGVNLVAAGGHHTCAILSTGGVLECWGANDHGQLGNASVGGNSPDPVPVTGR